MRVDRDRTPIAFDNMADRPLRGSLDWTLCEVVLNVDGAATRVSLGVLLSGRGRVWMSDVKLEAVGPDVPVTGGARPEAFGPPRNLDFEKGPR